MNSAIGFGSLDTFLVPIATGRTVVAVTGTAVQIGTTEGNLFVVQALPSNGAAIAIGGPASTDAVTTAGSERGMILNAGQSVTLPVRTLGTGTTRGWFVNGTATDGVVYQVFG